MTFERFLGEFKVKPELQTFLDRYGGWSRFVNLLGLTMLFITSSAQGQAGGTQATLERVNQAVRETQRLCADQTEQGAAPGLAIAVVFQDQVVYTAGFGVRDVDTREPVNADTVFQLASLSKAISSTVLAEFVGEGKISWDSRISDLDPGFAMYDPWVTREITISGSKSTNAIRIRNPRLAESAHRSMTWPSGCVYSSRMGNLRASGSSMKKHWP